MRKLYNFQVGQSMDEWMRAYLRCMVECPGVRMGGLDIDFSHTAEVMLCERVHEKGGGGEYQRR